MHVCVCVLMLTTSVLAVSRCSSTTKGELDSLVSSEGEWLLNECKELSNHFKHKCLDAVTKSVRTSLDQLRKRCFLRRQDHIDCLLCISRPLGITSLDSGRSYRCPTVEITDSPQRLRKSFVYDLYLLRSTVAYKMCMYVVRDCLTMT